MSTLFAPAGGWQGGTLDGIAYCEPASPDRRTILLGDHATGARSFTSWSYLGFVPYRLGTPEPKLEGGKRLINNPLGEPRLVTRLTQKSTWTGIM